MYLSRLILNPASRNAQRDMNQAYQLHRTISHAFPHDPPFSDERVLFRLEYHRKERMWWTLVQSRHAPDWKFLELNEWGNYLLRPVDIKIYEPVFAPGTGYRFRLLANPTFKTMNEKTNKKARLNLFDAEDQVDWLQRKLSSAGSEVLDLCLVPQGMRRSHKMDEIRQQVHKQTHLAILFEGVLRVTEPDALRAAVENGIGPAKGYGFGLLSLAPIS